MNCNINLGGNQYEYAKKLGMKKAEALTKLKGKTVKWTEQDFMEKIKYYLEDEFAREQLAGEGYTHANNTLMVQDRVKQMLEIVKERL